MTIKHEVHAFLDEIDDTLVYRHSRHSVGECKYCDTKRVYRIHASFIRRLDESRTNLEGIFLWSLGTSLTDTEANRRLLNEWWRLFTKRMNHHPRWVPLFRVRETGRRGFLHFHVVCGNFIHHKIILEKWRKITGEKSNVNVSGYKGHRNPSVLIGYLVKYLSKSSSAYRWMGPLYGVGGRSINERVTPGKGVVRELKHMGVVHGWTLPHVDERQESSEQKVFNER